MTSTVLVQHQTKQEIKEILLYVGATPNQTGNKRNTALLSLNNLNII
jgi:hypothetical protein